MSKCQNWEQVLNLDWSLAQKIESKLAWDFDFFFLDSFLRLATKFQAHFSIRVQFLLRHWWNYDLLSNENSVRRISNCVGR